MSAIPSRTPPIIKGSLWKPTHEILRKLSYQTHRPHTQLLHEAVQLLQAKYAEEQSPHDRRVADRTPTPPTAA